MAGCTSFTDFSYLCAMQKITLRLTFILLIVIALAGCSKYQRIYKSNDNDLKYEAAIAYYENKDYYRALQLFDLVLPMVRGTEREEKISYYYAYSYYHQRDYILAGYYFKRFANNFPSSRYAEESFFMSAYCSYLNSAPPTLDQTSTIEAIRDFQAFANRYPKSDRVERCNELIDKLRLNLEEKSFRQAMLYFRMDEYQAAIISFQNLMKEFPDTRYQEQVMFNIIKAWYNYAEKSVPSKRVERHQAAINAFNDFRALFPESRFLKEAQNLIQASYQATRNT